MRLPDLNFKLKSQSSPTHWQLHIFEFPVTSPFFFNRDPPTVTVAERLNSSSVQTENLNSDFASCLIFLLDSDSEIKFMPAAGPGGWASVVIQAAVDVRYMCLLSK
jgi:hypothetical protein